MCACACVHGHVLWVCIHVCGWVCVGGGGGGGGGVGVCVLGVFRSEFFDFVFLV